MKPLKKRVQCSIWFWIGFYAVILAAALLVAVFLFGCQGPVSITVFSWKSTAPIATGANSTATASPTQPVTISDNTATGLP